MSVKNGTKIMASYDPSKDAERRELCDFLLHSGKKLSMPQLTISTSIILFHRFYTKYTFEEYDKKKIGVTCLFLAGKIQETPKKIKDVIKVAYNVDYESSEFPPLRDELFKCERVLLQAISFEFAIEPPYHELVRRAKKIISIVPMPDDKKSNFHQVAWNFVNDSLKTTLCLQYEPKLIASAAIYLTIQYLRIEIPGNDLSILEAKLEDLENISNQILDLYESVPSNNLKSSMPASTSSTTTPPTSSTNTADSNTNTNIKPSDPPNSSSSAQSENKSGDSSSSDKIIIEDDDPSSTAL